MALGPVATGTAAKLGFKVLGDAASKAYGAVAGAGRALGSLSGALNSASEDLNKQKPENQESPTNVIYVNFGMAGSAARQRVTGGGNLPAPKNTAKPQVSEKMPTEALLDTAVKYLTSIDKSLKAQLEFEKRTYEQQVRDERESIIEEKNSSFSFSDIKDRLSGLKSSAQEAGGTLATIAKFAAGIGGLAALAAASLDTTQLDELKANLDAFKEKFSWLSEIPDGGLGGFLVGLLFGKGIAGRLKSGVKFGLMGILTSAVADVIFSRVTGGEISEDTRSILNVGAAAGLGYLGYRGVRSAMAIPGTLRDARATMATQRANRSYYNPSLQRVQNAATGRTMATNTATGFLKSPRWQRFLNWLTNNGKRTLVNKIQQRIAIAVGTGAVAATGVGAAFGAIGFLLNLGFSLYLMYQIYDLWQQFTAQDEAEKAGVGDAEIAKEIKQPNATPVGGSGVSSQSSGTSFTSATSGQNKTITGVIEGGRGYTTVTYSDGTTERRTGTLPARTNNPGNIMYGPIAISYGAVGSSPSTNGPPVAVFPTPTHGFAAMDGLLTSNYSNGPIGQTIEKWATDPTHPAKVLGTAGVDPGKKYTDFTHDEKVRFMRALAKVEGYYAAGSGPSISSSTMSGGLGASMSRMANASLESMGKVLGAIGGAVVSPGIARNLTPSVSNAPEEINNNSMQINNDIALGIRKKEAESEITSPTAPGTIPGIAQPIASISSIDPNYGSIDVLSRYLAHFRMAA